MATNPISLVGEAPASESTEREVSGSGGSGGSKTDPEVSSSAPHTGVQHGDGDHEWGCDRIARVIESTAGALANHMCGCVVCPAGPVRFCCCC